MRTTIATALLLTLAGAAATAQATPKSHEAQEFKWGPAPAVFPPGAQMAVLQGDPSTSNLFTVRLRFPDGYKIAPHTHPTDEYLTVVAGTFRVGMGKKFETKGMLTLSPGGFATAPANAAHYAAAQGTTIVQIHSMGPFALTYVNPADTPKAAVAKK